MPGEQQSQKQIIEFCSNPHLVNYVCLCLRPGICGWMTELEYTKFKPDTFANDGFHVCQCKWPENDPIPPLTMVIVSIDKSGQEFAESILWKHGLKKAPDGSVAIMLGDPEGPQEFFLKGSNVFYLSTHSEGAENVVYKNDPDKTKLAWEHEKAQCKKFHDEHEAWLATPEGEKIADEYWATHPDGRSR